jgi:hypothetical protein
MPKCRMCGTPTQLHVNGVPICPECFDPTEEGKERLRAYMPEAHRSAMLGSSENQNRPVDYNG